MRELNFFKILNLSALIKTEHRLHDHVIREYFAEIKPIIKIIKTKIYYGSVRAFQISQNFKLMLYLENSKLKCFSFT